MIASGVKRAELPRSYVVIVLAGLACITALTVFDKPVTDVVTFLGPVIAALFLAGHITGVTEKQNDEIAKIETQNEQLKQTTEQITERVNGQLTEKIDGIHSHITEAIEAVQVTADAAKDREPY